MKKLLNTLIIGLLLCCLLKAQERPVIKADFKFKDGVYFDLSSLKANQPAFVEDSLISVLAINPTTYLAQVEMIKQKSGKLVDLEMVRIICDEGRPFIQIDKEKVGKTVPSFAGFYLKGRLNYFFYEEVFYEEVDIKAYNPTNGRPFRQATVNRKQTRFVHQVLDLEKGEIWPLSKRNLEIAIQKDNKLYKVLRGMSGDIDLKTLLNVIKRFNQNNPL